MCRRRWFQFHLSTLVLLTLSAGGLMWLNFRPREHWVVYRYELPGGDSTIEVWGRQPGTAFVASSDSRYGWPLTCCTESHDLSKWISAPSQEMTLQQMRELDALPSRVEYDLEELWAAAPSVTDRIVFEAELSREERGKRKWYYAWAWEHLALDLLVAVALLVVLALSCELFTRRRAEAKDPEVRADR